MGRVEMGHREMGNREKLVSDVFRVLRLLKGFENILLARHVILLMVVGTQPRGCQINERSTLIAATVWRRVTGTPHSVSPSATIPQTWAVCSRGDYQLPKSFAQRLRHPLELLHKLVEYVLWQLPQVGSSSALCVYCWQWSYCTSSRQTISPEHPTLTPVSEHQSFLSNRPQTASNWLISFQKSKNRGSGRVWLCPWSCSELLGRLRDNISLQNTTNTRLQEIDLC